MNGKQVLTLGAAAVCALAGVAVAQYDLKQAPPTAPAAGVVSGVAKEQPEQPSAPPESSGSGSAASGEAAQTAQAPAGGQDGPVYWLRSSEGRLGVFLDDAPEPEMVLDVYISSLPEADRAALESGVRAGSYQELVSMIEDYIS